MKVKKALVPVCFFSLLFMSATSISPLSESKRKFSAINLVNDTVADMTSEEQISLSKKKFYQFVSNDITYYVADEYQAMDDSNILIRTMDNFSEYPYLKSVSLDSSKKVIEYQNYDSISNEFTKEFRYIPDSLYYQIKENSMEVDKEEDFNTYNSILNAFQYEIDYARKLGKMCNFATLRSSPGKITHYLDTGNQANLDLFIKNKDVKHKNTLFVNNASKVTFDDEITQLIPKTYFGIPQTRQVFGTEWGFYMDTYSYGFSQYISEIFLFDVEIKQADQINAEIFTVTPVVNATYLYDSSTDIVSFFQDNTFGIINPLYMSNIIYVSDYIETYNDYDELEYVPINEHPLNPSDKGYLLSKDNGLFFSDYGFLSTQKTTNSFSNALFKLTFDATKAILLDLIPNNLVSLAVGKTIDGIGLLSKKIIEKINATHINKENLGYKTIVDDSKNYVIYFNSNQNYDADEEIDNRNLHKIVSLDLSNQSDLFLSTNKDSISFYEKIVYSKKINNSYKGLISHSFNFDIAKGTAKKHQTICSMSNNIGYTYQPTYQTGNMSISNPFGIQEETFIQLGANNDQPFELKFTSPKDGNYLFSFSNLPSKTKIIFPDNTSFDSGEKEKAMFDQDGFKSEQLRLPIINDYKKEVYIKKGMTINFKINRFRSADTASTYSFGCFSVYIYQLESPITDLPDIQSVLTDSYGEYSTSSSYQTISFKPKLSGLHTLSMYNDTLTCSFLVTDSKGRTLYKMYSADSERSIILNLKEDERYFIHFLSYSNSHTVRFFIDSCRYLPSVLPSENTNYSYVKKNIEFTFLFSSYTDTTAKFSLQPTSAYVSVNIYDHQHRLLQSPYPAYFSFSFSAGKIYYIQIRFFRYDSNLINPAFLQVKGA